MQKAWENRNPNLEGDLDFAVCGRMQLRLPEAAAASGPRDPETDGDLGGQHEGGGGPVVDELSGDGGPDADEEIGVAHGLDLAGP